MCFYNRIYWMGFRVYKLRWGGGVRFGVKVKFNGIGGVNVNLYQEQNKIAYII